MGNLGPEFHSDSWKGWRLLWLLLLLLLLLFWRGCCSGLAPLTTAPLLSNLLEN
jgi:hypothetical protein